jgi:hypothetical protein
MLRHLLVQCGVLLKKNWWLSLRHWKVTLIQLVSPIAFVVVLFLLQLLYKNVQNEQNNTTATSLSHVPKCTTLHSFYPCVSIIYSPTRGQYKHIDAIIDHFAHANGYSISDEPIDRVYPKNIEHDIYSIQNQENMTDFIIKHPNITQAG